MSVNLRVKEIAGKINRKFGAKVRVQRERRLWIKITKANLVDSCEYVKRLGFGHLSAISVTDLFKAGDYEIAYHLWSYRDKMALTIKTKIKRENPVIDSVAPVWGKNAQIHERESHELFGVKFSGNPDLSELFLEDWHGPPPFRRDFDWKAYVKTRYYDKENEREKGYWEVMA
jgi:NADH-quinone oxidoreductase subunit C